MLGNRILVRKTGGKKPLGKSRHRWEVLNLQRNALEGFRLDSFVSG
jgi:hypothetical protein